MYDRSKNVWELILAYQDGMKMKRISPGREYDFPLDCAYQRYEDIGRIDFNFIYHGRELAIRKDTLRLMELIPFIPEETIRVFAYFQWIEGIRIMNESHMSSNWRAQSKRKERRFLFYVFKEHPAVAAVAGGSPRAIVEELMDIPWRNREWRLNPKARYEMESILILEAIDFGNLSYLKESVNYPKTQEGKIDPKDSQSWSTFQSSRRRGNATLSFSSIVRGLSLD